MGGGLLQSLHIPDKTSGAQSPSQPPADPVGACAPGGPARVCCGYFRLAEWGSQQAHTRKGQFLPSHLGGTLGDWPPIQDCGSPAPSTAVSAQWAPWTEEALEWPPCCEETLAAHGEAPVEPTKRPPTLRSDDFPVNSPANAPAMGVRHLGSSESVLCRQTVSKHFSPIYACMSSLDVNHITVFSSCLVLQPEGGRSLM
ncbi:uncharacterized protein LOC121104444 isoform X7 [Ursus maritimus]|uniref:Uncharacterized protein LOC121104444 isoform X7 n=1 Tax=Ursus maritimus TaxID=29073 RepID=A0A8M1GD61_URSMA|nr:uncharacterized protein LOC121104444 isoform X7 [Ursus maritimus]